MATSIEEIQEQMSIVSSEILANETSIDRILASKLAAFNLAKSYANFVREGAGNCEWKTMNQSFKWDGRNMFGPAYTQLPGRIKKPTSNSHGDCGWKAEKMFIQIDKVVDFQMEYASEERILDENVRFLNELSEIHEALIISSNQFIEMGDKITSHKIKVEKLNEAKAMVTKKRAEAGIPFILFALIGVGIVLTLIYLFKKK